MTTLSLPFSIPTLILTPIHALQSKTACRMTGRLLRKMQRHVFIPDTHWGHRKSFIQIRPSKDMVCRAVVLTIDIDELRVPFYLQDVRPEDWLRFALCCQCVLLHIYLASPHLKYHIRTGAPHGLIVTEDNCQQRLAIPGALAVDNFREFKGAPVHKLLDDMLRDTDERQDAVIHREIDVGPRLYLQWLVYKVDVFPFSLWHFLEQSLKAISTH